MIDPKRWKSTLTVPQLAKRFGVEKVTVYSYIHRHGLKFKKQKLGRRKSAMKAPTLAWHKKCIYLYKQGESHIPTLARLLKKEYATVYRVIQRYKAYKASQQYEEAK